MSNNKAKKLKKPDSVSPSELSKFIDAPSQSIKTIPLLRPRGVRLVVYPLQYDEIVKMWGKEKTDKYFIKSECIPL